MSPATVPFLIAASLLEAYALRYDMLRSWRTVALWALTCGAIAIAGAPGLAILQGAAVLVFAVLVLVRNEPLRAMRPRDWQFVENYRRMSREIEEIPPVKEVGVDVFKGRWDEITDKLRETDAPDAEWSALRNATVAELRSRRQAMEDPALLTPEFLNASRERWADLQDRFRQLVRRHMAFWLLLPWD